MLEALEALCQQLAESLEPFRASKHAPAAPVARRAHEVVSTYCKVVRLAKRLQGETATLELYTRLACPLLEAAGGVPPAAAGVADVALVMTPWPAVHWLRHVQCMSHSMLHWPVLCTPPTILQSSIHSCCIRGQRQRMALHRHCWRGPELLPPLLLPPPTELLLEAGELALLDSAMGIRANAGALHMIHLLVDSFDSHPMLEINSAMEVGAPARPWWCMMWCDGVHVGLCELHAAMRT